MLVRRLLVLALVILGPAAVQAQTDLEVRDAHLHFDGGAVLHLTVAPYSTAAHILELCGGDDGYPCTLGGAPMFGTDGTEPSTVLEAADLEVGGRRVPLDVSGMANPWVDRPYEGQFEVVADPDIPERWRVVARLSDGAGYYVAVWEVARGGASRTALLPGETYDVCMGEGE